MPCAHCERIARVADAALRDGAAALGAKQRECEALTRELARARETLVETQRCANDALVRALEATTTRADADADACAPRARSTTRVRAVFDALGPVPTTPAGRRDVRAPSET